MKWLIFILVLLFPLAMNAFDQQFYISFATRVLIYAMAAASLNLVLGYGGMVSFGHAAFFGAGAYVAGILTVEGITSAWLTWPAAVVAAALERTAAPSWRSRQSRARSSVQLWIPVVERESLNAPQGPQLTKLVSQCQ